MNYLVKIFIFLPFILSALHMNAQVTSVQYGILLNPTTNLIDCFIYVEEGHASSARERVQFNAQYSLLIPTGGLVSMESTYNPLTYNQNFEGEQPIKWNITNKVKSPEINPEYDFYGITPTLAPAGFYNVLNKGDFIKLFSIKVEGEDVDLNDVRLYDNNVDPKSYGLGMENGDFSNGFTIGGFNQIFNGIKNIEQAKGTYTLSDRR
jgi:hypothetical protein